jgi:hypothetical protein
MAVIYVDMFSSEAKLRDSKLPQEKIYWRLTRNWFVFYYSLLSGLAPSKV